MISTKGYAANTKTSELAPFSFERREVGPNDVLIDILYCGVCHSDIHQARDEWGGSIYPMVPGHEIVGRVTKVGASVKNFKVGDTAGVGCLVDSCRTCSACAEGEESYCEEGMTPTYNGLDKSGQPTFGGYSTQMVCDEKYTLKVSPKIPLDRAAPLLCAGITTYSPLKHWKVGKGSKVAIVGLGGLGHMGVKFAAAFGAEVTVLSTTRSKEADARRLGAHHFAATIEPGTFEKLKRTFDFVLDTVSAPHDLNSYLSTLKRDGSLVLVGLPEKPAPVNAFALVGGRKNLSGSAIGGIRETQEMLDFCAEHQIASDIELIPIQKINEAYERMGRNDVRYRFVLDMASLK